MNNSFVIVDEKKVSIDCMIPDCYHLNPLSIKSSQFVKIDHQLDSRQRGKLVFQNILQNF